MNDAFISVQGTGRVQIRPDLARIRLSCSVEHERAASAFDSCSIATAAVIEALRSADIADGDLATSGIQLSRRHDTDRYIGQNHLVVTVRPPERTGRILAVAVDAGGDALEIHNLEFGLADNTPALSAARTEAVHHARSTAEELAGAARVSLGRLVSLTEGGAGPVPGRRMAARAMAAPAPVEVGDQEVAVTVTAVFEIAGGAPVG